MPLKVLTPSEFSQAPEAAPGLPPADPALIALQAPDLHLAEPEGHGRLSLWWTQVPEWPGERLGVLGHFAADSEALTVTLLEEGCRRLAQAGCTFAIGPMDGNTWRSYRFVTDPGTEPPFALEPANPAEWPLWWTRTRFEPFQTYQSALERQLEPTDPRLAKVEARLEKMGVRLRPLDLDAFDEELGRIFEVSEVAFRDNVLYTPLARAEFLAMYQKVRPFAQPRLVWLAEQDQPGAAPRPVGFVFTVPDLLEARRGLTPTTLIVKTLAKAPDARLGGLGALLLAKVQSEARNMGFTRAIHALMHDHNSSRNMGQEAEVIRRYTLFGRRL